MVDNDMPGLLGKLIGWDLWFHDPKGEGATGPWLWIRGHILLAPRCLSCAIDLS